MLYVEAEKASQLALGYEPTPAELERLGQLIEAVWKHVMDLDFPDISKYSPDIEGISQFEADLIAGKI
jgi:hypothetical protein